MHESYERQFLLDNRGFLVAESLSTVQQRTATVNREGGNRMAIQRGGKKTKAVTRKPAKAVSKPARRAQRVSRASAPRIATHPETISDYEGARQLLSLYCHALDQQRLTDLGSLFHRDAQFSVSFEGEQKHTGRETIQAWYDRFFQQRPGQYRHMRHKIFEPLLMVDGGTATAETYFDADSVDEGGAVRVVTGRYDDVLVREQGQWFFKTRTVTVLYRYSPGQCQQGV
jgi:SnoaL-like domain